jgi:hypothetical protein
MMAAMSPTALLGIASVMSWGIGAVVMIAFVVAIAIVVRRHRPDAAPILLGATIFELLISVAGYVTTMALPRLMSVSMSPGYSSYMEAQALSTVIFSVAHATARVCLLWGILRLAQPVNG